MRTTPYETSTAAAAHSATSGQLPSVTISFDRTSSACAPNSDWFSGLQLREVSRTPMYGSRDAAAMTPVTITASAAERSRATAATANPATHTARMRRSEEHTSELQSPCNLVCRLLLEKKKNKH